MDDALLENALNRAQEHMARIPLILLGSGASVDFGIPGVKVLAQYLQQDQRFGGLGSPDDDNWGRVIGALTDDHLGIEAALDRVGKEMGEVVQRLTLPPVQLPGMDLVRGGDLGDRLLFFQHFEHHLGFERRGMMFLLWHDVSSVTLEALQTCLVFGDHYRLWGIRQITQDFRERRAVSNDPTQASDYDVSADRVKPDHSVAKDFSA